MDRCPGVAESSSGADDVKAQERDLAGIGSRVGMIPSQGERPVYESPVDERGETIQQLEVNASREEESSYRIGRHGGGWRRSYR